MFPPDTLSKCVCSGLRRLMNYTHSAPAVTAAQPRFHPLFYSSPHHFQPPLETSLC